MYVKLTIKEIQKIVMDPLPFPGRDLDINIRSSDGHNYYFDNKIPWGFMDEVFPDLEGICRVTFNAKNGKNLKLLRLSSIPSYYIIWLSIHLMTSFYGESCKTHEKLINSFWKRVSRNFPALKEIADDCIWTKNVESSGSYFWSSNCDTISEFWIIIDETSDSPDGLIIDVAKGYDGVKSLLEKWIN